MHAQHKHILVTGAAGFIGYHLTKRLLAEGYRVVALDNLNDYYDRTLKLARLASLGLSSDRFVHGRVIDSELCDLHFVKMDLVDESLLNQLFDQYGFHTVIHLAAQAGVRYSLEDPAAYIESNMLGFFRIIDAARRYEMDHFIYASSSSVYGLHKTMPLSTAHRVDHPISLYAATKKSNELVAHSYSHLYNLPTTGLRFFTVYGPWGRPDMAYYKFTDAIFHDRPIQVYNYGDLYRDFTYISDIVEALVRLIPIVPTPNSLRDESVQIPHVSPAPYQLFNIGANTPIHLLDFIDTLQRLIGQKAQLELLPMQPGDVYKTYADTRDLEQAVRYTPQTTLDEGLELFVDWYRDYHQL